MDNDSTLWQPMTLLAFHMNSFESRLSALVLMAIVADEGSLLPEKDDIALDQHTPSWPEVAVEVGEKSARRAAVW